DQPFGGTQFDTHPGSHRGCKNTDRGDPVDASDRVSTGTRQNVRTVAAPACSNRLRAKRDPRKSPAHTHAGSARGRYPQCAAGIGRGCDAPNPSSTRPNKHGPSGGSHWETVQNETPIEGSQPALFDPLIGEG